jgi:hypothetical protein
MLTATILAIMFGNVLAAATLPWLASVNFVTNARLEQRRNVRPAGPLGSPARRKRATSDRAPPHDARLATEEIEAQSRWLSVRSDLMMAPPTSG